MSVCVATQLARLKLARAPALFPLHNETAVNPEETSLLLAINQLNWRSWEVRGRRRERGNGLMGDGVSWKFRERQTERGNDWVRYDTVHTVCIYHYSYKKTRLTRKTQQVHNSSMTSRDWVLSTTVCSISLGKFSLPSTSCFCRDSLTTIFTSDCCQNRVWNICYMNPQKISCCFEPTTTNKWSYFFNLFFVTAKGQWLDSYSVCRDWMPLLPYAKLN